MDDFDRRLEIELASFLDPIVDAPAPWRRRQSTLRAVNGGLTEALPEVVVVHEPVAVTAPVATPI